jgi:hypothetical protein
MYNGMKEIDDYHYLGAENDIAYERVFEFFKSMTIDYYLFKLDDSTDKMFENFKEIFDRVNA